VTWSVKSYSPGSLLNIEILKILGWGFLRNTSQFRAVLDMYENIIWFGSFELWFVGYENEVREVRSGFQIDLLQARPKFVFRTLRLFSTRIFSKEDFDVGETVRGGNVKGDS